jgi:hypothetical protein
MLQLLRISYGGYPHATNRTKLPGIERAVSECHLRLPQGEGHTPVILGEEGDEALLGVITLEELRLVLNPFTRQLQPMRVLLA